MDEIKKRNQKRRTAAEELLGNLPFNNSKVNVKETKTENDSVNEDVYYEVKGNENEKVLNDVNVSIKRNRENIVNEFLASFKAKYRTGGIEETHKRQTFLVKKDLIIRLDELAKKKRKGFKTEFINFAIENLLDDLEAMDE